MRTLVLCILTMSLALSLAVLPAAARPVTEDDARSVAQNWVALTIRQQGDWGGSPTAQIGEVREFRQGDRLIGYFCPVSPEGFIIVSLRRELAPVKAFSDTSNLDPDADEGLPALIRLKMAALLDGIEAGAGPIESVSTAAVTPLMEFTYLDAWETLDSAAPSSGDEIEALATASNYGEGGVMLATQWHQFAPYYNDCPAPPTGSTCANPHCCVGCVATAGAQVMAYWDWPPYGAGGLYGDVYDWPRMANEYLYDAGQARWEDENGNPLTQAHIDAVAELSHEVGVAVGMNYCAGGGCASSAYTDDMMDVYEDHYRYADATDKESRNDHTASSWYTLLKAQFNLNRPVQYRVVDHSIVGDGWRDFYVGSDLVREYHMNYGWQNTGANTWYTLDGLIGGGVDEEYIVRNIYPAPSLGTVLSGTYAKPTFPYRYFDRDAAGNSATFSAGQYLQFLPGVTATCNSGTGTAVRFEGISAANTRLFSRGDTTRGALLKSGTIMLKPGGSVQFA